jgi:hypothetical protein
LEQPNRRARQPILRLLIERIAQAEAILARRAWVNSVPTNLFGALLVLFFLIAIPDCQWKPTI